MKVIFRPRRCKARRKKTPNNTYYGRCDLHRYHHGRHELWRGFDTVVFEADDRLRRCEWCEIPLRWWQRQACGKCMDESPQPVYPRGSRREEHP